MQERPFFKISNRIKYRTCNSLSEWNDFIFPKTDQFVSYFFGSQTIDNWIQRRGEDQRPRPHESPQEWRNVFNSVRYDGEKAQALQQEEDDEVRGACLQRFCSGAGLFGPEAGDEDLEVRVQYHAIGHKLRDGNAEKAVDVVHGCVCADEAQQAGIVTVGERQLGATAWQTQQQDEKHGYHEQVSEPHACNDLQDISVCHDAIVLQGTTYGDVAVIGHGGQHEYRPSGVDMNEEGLSDAGRMLDGPAVEQQLFDLLNEVRRGAHKVIDREVEQEEINGLVQRLVECDDEDEDAVAQKDDHVAQRCKEECGEHSLRGQFVAFQLYD